MNLHRTILSDSCLRSALVLALTPLGIASGDGTWPSFLGPRHDAVSTESSWVSEGAEKSLWETNVGLGYSGVTIADGRLYTLGHDAEAGEDVVWCLDALTGEKRWTHRFPSAIWKEMHTGGTLTTPTIDGDALYVQNREGNMFRFDAESGEVLWHRQLAEEHELKHPKWGFAASPLVLGDELYVNVGKVLRLDKKDGKTVWQSEDFGDAYADLVPYSVDGAQQLLVFNGKGLALIERKDGAQRAFVERKARFDINASSPVLVDGRILVSSGLGGGATLFARAEEGFEPVWQNKSMSTKMTSCVRLGSHLYGFDEAVLTCIDEAGETAWAERGIGNGAILGTPERLLFTSADGELIVAAANPEKYTELARAKVFDDGAKYWTRPTLVDGLVYVRSSFGALACRDHRAKK